MKQTRRKFIRNAALGGAALSFGFCHSPQKKDKRLGVALVGLGSYSGGQLAPALQMTKHCYLAGIVTGSPHKIPQWQKQYGIKDQNVYNYDTLAQIADNPEIDVIYIVVPTGLHAKYAVMAANTGKHVWCEKPMAMNSAECQQIIEACDKNKVKLSIGYRMQHEPNTQTVIRYASEKPYGEIEAVEALAGYRGGVGTGWRFQKALGGGALYDMGVYAINGIRYATGMEPIRVLRAEHLTNRPQYFSEVDETTDFTLEFAQGLKAHGRTSVGEGINRLRVDCAQGWYELSPMQSYGGVQGRTSDGKKLDIFIANQQARQMDDNAQAILEKQAVLVPGEEGLRDIRIVNAIQESARTGKSVEL